MENNIYIEDIFKGILTGFLASYLIILGMRPAAIYPDNILDIIDNPWIFLILFIINYYILIWDFTIGLLLFLTLIALILDIIIFTHGDFLKDIIKIVNSDIYSATSSTQTSSTQNEDNNKIKNSFTDSYKDINDIILGELLQYNLLYENNIKPYNSFL
jgi:hypothetical protein